MNCLSSNIMNRLKIKISDVYPNEGQVEGLPANPRLIKKEKVEQLKKSIQDLPEMTEARDLLVYPHNGKFIVIGGNMRLRAYRELGWKEVPCCILPENMPVDKLREIVIQDNNPFGETDWNMIANEWDVEELKDWGVDLPADWDTSGTEEQKEAEEDDFSDEDAEKAEPRVKLGEIWQLGEHRLMCGDSTDAASVALLMDGQKADMVFTDPPYGVDIVKGSHAGDGKVGGDKSFGSVGGGKIVKAKTYMTIKGDETTDTARLNYEIIKELSKEQIIFGGNYFTDFLPPKACWVIWDKQNTGNFADVEMAWTSMNKGAKLYQWLWNGLCRKGDREVEGKTRVHPTQKPVGLIVDILNDFTKENEVVLDCFGGSGSTLIACEQINRKCRMVEYEPYYCDIIIARWEKLTGKEAVKIYG